MKTVFNPFTGKLDYIDNIKQYSSDPISGEDGEIIINTTTNTLKIWNTDRWFNLYKFFFDNFFQLEDEEQILLQNFDYIALEG